MNNLNEKLKQIEQVSPFKKSAKTPKTKEELIREMDIIKKYVIFDTHPRTKIPIKEGFIKVNFKKKVMELGYIKWLA